MKAIVAEEPIGSLGVGGRISFLGEIGSPAHFTPSPELHSEKLAFFGGRMLPFSEYPELMKLATYLQPKAQRSRHSCILVEKALWAITTFMKQSSKVLLKT